MFTYSATFDGTQLTAGTLPPVAYDELLQEFSVYSEDTGLVGMHTITIDAYLTDHPSTTGSSTFQIEFLTPCEHEPTLILTPTA